MPKVSKFEEVDNMLNTVAAAGVEKTTPAEQAVKSERPVPTAQPVENRPSTTRTSGNVDAITQRLYKHYKSEERVEIMIAPMYAPYFGNKMTVSINGISIIVPCDGKKVSVPSTFAAEINRRIYEVNRRVEREKGMADKAVYEDSPGEARLF